MTCGFTGTEEGMTLKQRQAVLTLFRDLQLTELHHGDCIGADYEADTLACEFTSAAIVVHPPSDSKKRAYCSGPRHEVLPPKPYLKRNWSIVYGGLHGLIATPRQAVEPSFLRGQGTWTTIKYARKAGRSLWIVRPDGTILHEPGRIGA